MTQALGCFFYTMGLFQRWAIQLVFVSFAFFFLWETFLASDTVLVAGWNTWQQFFLGSPLAKIFAAQIHGKALSIPGLLILRMITLCFGLLGIISTYKLGFLLYNKRIGFVAALMSLGTIGLFQFQTTTHPALILYGITIFSVWRFMEWVYYKQEKDFTIAGVSLAVITMIFGYLALLLPLASLLSYYIGKGNYSAIRRFLLDKGWAIYLLLLVLFIGAFAISGSSWVGAQQVVWTFLCESNAALYTSVSEPLLLISPFGFLIIIAVGWRLFDLIRNFFTSRSHQEWLTPTAVFTAAFFTALFPNHLSVNLLIALPFLTIITSEYILRMVLEHKGIIVSILRFLQLFANGFLVYLIVDRFATTHPIALLVGCIFLVLGLYQWAQQKEPLYQVILSSTFTSLAVLAVWNTSLAG